MINLGGSVDCGAIVSENFWQHFWQKAFSAESHITPDPAADLNFRAGKPCRIGIVSYAVLPETV